VSEGQRGERDENESKELGNAHRESSSARTSRSACAVRPRERIKDNAGHCAVFRARNRPVMKRWTAHLLRRIPMP
jgi:hypothetical protein